MSFYEIKYSTHSFMKNGMKTSATIKVLLKYWKMVNKWLKLLGSVSIEPYSTIHISHDHCRSESHLYVNGPQIFNQRLHNKYQNPSGILDFHYVKTLQTAVLSFCWYKKIYIVWYLKNSQSPLAIQISTCHRHWPTCQYTEH